MKTKTSIGYLLGSFLVFMLSIGFFSLRHAGLEAMMILPWLAIFALFALIILFYRSWKNGILFTIILVLCPFVYSYCKWVDWTGTKITVSSFLLLLYSSFFWYRKNSFKISFVIIIIPMFLLASYVYKREQNHRLIDRIPFQISLKIHRCLEENAKQQLSLNDAREACSFDYIVQIPKSACLEMFKNEEARELGITKYPIHDGAGARDGWGNKLPQDYETTRYTSVKLNGEKIQLENCKWNNTLLYNLIPNQDDLEYYERRKEMEVKKEIKKVDEVIFSVPVALVATDTVWVALKNMTTEKVLVSKKFIRNESFIPEIPLIELAVSTGLPKRLDLYINGKKVKTFDKEKWLPLAEFAEVPLEKK